MGRIYCNLLGIYVYVYIYIYMYMFMVIGVLIIWYILNVYCSIVEPNIEFIEFIANVSSHNLWYIVLIILQPASVGISSWKIHSNPSKTMSKKLVYKWHQWIQILFQHIIVTYFHGISFSRAIKENPEPPNIKIRCAFKIMPFKMYRIQNWF